MIHPFESAIQRLNNQGVKNVVSNPSVATSAASKHLIIDLISLHVLFFQCRSCDSTLENCFLKRSYHSNAKKFFSTRVIFFPISELSRVTPPNKAEVMMILGQKTSAI